VRQVGASFADIARSAVGMAQAVASATGSRDTNATARDVGGLTRDGVSLLQQGQSASTATGTNRVDQLSRMIDAGGRLVQNTRRAQTDYDKRTLDRATQELRQNGYNSDGNTLRYRDRDGG
jgi:hypothetical protein